MDTPKLCPPLKGLLLAPLLPFLFLGWVAGVICTALQAGYQAGFDTLAYLVDR